MELTTYYKVYRIMQDGNGRNPVQYNLLPASNDEYDNPAQAELWIENNAERLEKFTILEVFEKR